MSVSRPFWRSTALSTGATWLLVMLYGVHEILTARTGMPTSDMFELLLLSAPLMLALSLPVGTFVGGFSAATETFEPGGRGRAYVIAAGGVALAVACMVIVGYISPPLRTASGYPQPYLHELPRAWTDALARGAAQPANAPMRWHEAGGVGWDLFFRLFWSLLVALMAGIGLLSGYWARWTPNRRIVALQGWAIALLLALGVATGLVVGREVALQSGAALFGAWQIVRVPLLVLVVLSWPTWLSLRSPRGAAPARSDGADA